MHDKIQSNATVKKESGCSLLSAMVTSPEYNVTKTTHRTVLTVYSLCCGKDEKFYKIYNYDIYMEGYMSVCIKSIYLSIYIPTCFFSKETMVIPRETDGTRYSGWQWKHHFSECILLSTFL